SLLMFYLCVSIFFYFLFFFFFSSRRRHTRSKRDWSSDVCSSDLTASDRWQLIMPVLVTKYAEGNPIGFFREFLLNTVVPNSHVRSEERRVGKECRCRWGRDAEKKKRSDEQKEQCEEDNERGHCML